MKKILAALFVVMLGVAFAAPILMANDCGFDNGGEIDDDLFEPDLDVPVMDAYSIEAARNRREAANEHIYNPRQVSEIDIGTSGIIDEPDIQDYFSEVDQGKREAAKKHIINPRLASITDIGNDEELEPHPTAHTFMMADDIAKFYRKFIENGGAPFIEFFASSPIKDEVKRASLPKPYLSYTSRTAIRRPGKYNQRIRKNMLQKKNEHEKQKDLGTPYERYATKLRAPIGSITNRGNTYDTTLQKVNGELTRTRVAPPVPADSSLNVDLDKLIKLIREPMPTRIPAVVELPKKFQKKIGTPIAPEWTTEVEED